MYTRDDYARASLVWGIAAFFLMAFWLVVVWLDPPWMFGIPATWQYWFILGAPALSMLGGGAALMCGLWAHHLGRPDKHSASLSPARVPSITSAKEPAAASAIGAALGFIAAVGGLLAILLIVVAAWGWSSL